MTAPDGVPTVLGARTRGIGEQTRAVGWYVVFFCRLPNSIGLVTEYGNRNSVDILRACGWLPELPVIRRVEPYVT